MKQSIQVILHMEMKQNHCEFLGLSTCSICKVILKFSSENKIEIS